MLGLDQHLNHHGLTVKNETSYIIQKHYVFKNPHHSHKRQGIAVTPILEDNPDFKSRIIWFAQDNLQVLTSEFLHSNVIEQFVPNLVKKINDEDATATDVVSDDKLLKRCNLKIISLRTIQRWMSQLGFTYKLWKKMLLCQQS